MYQQQKIPDSSEWFLSAIGNCAGKAWSGKQQFHIHHSECTVLPFGDLQLCPEGGKFSDSEDSFLFAFTRIDPACQNFRLSALFEAEPTDQDCDQQSGFGILLADTTVSADQFARHRNHVLLGVFSRKRTCGVRIVAGYTDPSAAHLENKRILDQSRTFPDAPRGLPVHQLRLEVEKSNLGLTFTCGDESIFVPGCDYLMHQAPHEISVGFAAARGLSIYIRDIQFQITTGKASMTPNGEIQNRPEKLPRFWERLKQPTPSIPCTEDIELFVAPDARSEGTGSNADPMPLEKAISLAGAGTVIHLYDGNYALKKPCVILSHQSGTPLRPVRLLAHTVRKVILNGSALPADTPACILAADFWQIHGIIFRKAPLSGLLICGHGCRVDDCEADTCGDTGILIQAPPDRREKNDWPSYNEIIHCDSHDNQDQFHTNADGFGAKLRVGPGNLFYDCAAYHNCDDGFDLYTKSTIGPIGSVVMDQCIAFENGQYKLNEQTFHRKRGVGFKLGGENICVQHTLWHCIAFRNADLGFSGNSNPDSILHGCLSSENIADKHASIFSIPPYSIRQIRYLPVLPQELMDLKSPIRDENRTLRFPQSMKHHAEKKILIMIPSLGGGGAERVACRLASALSEHHKVSLLYSSDEKIPYPISNRVSLICTVAPAFLSMKKGIPRSIMRRLSWPCRMLDLYQLKKSRHIDTSISLMSGPNMKNALVPGSRRILSERNDPSHKPVSYRIHAQISYALSDYTVFQTEKVRHMFSRQIQRKSCIILNPVDVECEAFPERRKKIVSAGRLHPQKNQDLLIRAFAQFHLEHPVYELFLYGTGPLQESLESRIHELGITDCAHIVPFSLNLHAEIRDAEMFVLSSDYEGLSNALMEAMCMGIACISTDCTGSPELLDHGNCGLLTPVGDCQALCDAMCRLSENTSFRRKLETRARRRSMAFLPERILREWERIL